jgi:5-methylthioadenosine/S-adenosylhomocysteine deaminase
MGQVSSESRVTPGFVDAHSHLRSTSYAEHGVSGTCLEEGLLRMNAMSSVDTAEDVFVACAELLEKGVTGVQVMFHTFGDPDDYREELDRVFQGILRSGIRALVILGTTDQAEFLPPGAEALVTLPEFARVSRRLTPAEYGDVVSSATSPSPAIEIGIGPVGPQWCSDSLLHTIGDLAEEGYRIHSHFAESSSQRSWAGSLYERMRSARLFGPRTSLAHSVWLTNEEIQSFADQGVSLVTCPLSNHLLGAGTAPVAKWLQAGVTVAVGLDSADRVATPMSVARRSLSVPDSLDALTAGGQRATGLATAADSVTWEDIEKGSVQSVSVGGVSVVQDGRHLRQGELDDARAHIAEHLRSDQSQRQEKLQTINKLIPEYLRAIREVTGEG